MLGAELKTGGGGVGGKARGREESLEARSLKNRRPKLSLRVLSFLIRDFILRNPQKGRGNKGFVSKFSK